MTQSDYNQKANELNNKYSKINARVVAGWGNQLQIEVETVDQAKALKEMNRQYVFRSGQYIS